jgi:2-polyprenyl-3-methyl-5-hydroxy-6-metoxy-1,4-benzoquinol methylase
MVAINWDKRYKQGDTPWAHSEPVAGLLETIQQYVPKDASLLEVGCGYGVEALQLSAAGYQVTATDLSTTVIDKAKMLAKKRNDERIQFAVLDLINEPINHTFDAVLDIAVLMPLATKGQLQQQVIAAIRSALPPSGYWFSMSCLQSEVASIEQETGIQGPPAIQLNDFKKWVSESFAIVDTVNTTYEVTRNGHSVAFPAKLFVLKSN